MSKLASLVLFFAAVAGAVAAPIDDLASPDPTVRAVAASIVRRTYVAPVRAKWEPLLAKLHLGMSRRAIDELLKPYRAKFEIAYASGGESAEFCRLDDAWALRAAFNMWTGAPRRAVLGPSNTLMWIDLDPGLRNVWVSAPPHFSGTWTTYLVNGHAGETLFYRDGICLGDFLGNHPETDVHRQD